MRVFLTGASGFIGSAIIQELLAAGHSVLGLARSEASAAKLTAAGIDVHHGSLEDLDSLKRGAAACDGVIHTAFIHDFSKYIDNCEIDRHVIEAMGAALEGTNKPLIVTSGTGVVYTGKPLTENDAPAQTQRTAPRIATEEAAAAVAARGVRASVVRLPPTVHGEGDHGFIPMLINIAREKGISAYVGDGTNRWPAVHRLDAAKLFRLALESRAASPRYHAVADEGIATRHIAETIAKHLNLPLVSLTPEQASTHFGWLASFLSHDIPAASHKTQQQLSWSPQHPSLLPDLEACYFNH